MARVPYVPREELDPEHRDLVVSTLQDGKPVDIYAAIANNPPVLAGLRSYLGALWSDSGLSDRQRELVTLAVAAEVRNEYEWHQHVNVARGVGLSDAEMAAIAADDLDEFPADEALLVEYARSVATGAVTDEGHAAVADRFGDSVVVGAAAVAACYVQVGLLIDALGVDVEEGDEFVGWDPE